MVTTFLFLVSIANGASDIKLQVTSAKYNYSLSIEKEKLNFESQGRKVERKIQKCSRRAYDLFSRNLRSTLKKDLVKTNVKIDSSVHASLDGKDFYYPLLSRGAEALAKVETDIDYLISEAVYRCSKK